MMDVEYLLWLEFLTNLLLPILEIFIAIWLVLRPDPISLISTLVLLGCYVGYLIQVHWIGGVSCKCLGSAYSNVQFMIGIDLLAISCLLIHNEFIAIFRQPVIIVGCAAIVPIASLFWINCQGFATAVSRSMNPGPLRTEFYPQYDLPTSAKLESDVVIANRTRQAVDIDQIMISCGCTQFYPQQVKLAPGGSETIHLSIDLNKAFLDNQSPTARLEVSAGCYDKDLNDIDQVKIFLGTTYRTFAPASNVAIYQWQSSGDKEQVSIPINWFSTDGPRNLQVAVDGVVVPSVTTDDFVRFAIDRPNKPFNTVEIGLNHKVGTAHFSAIVKLQVAAKPGRVLATTGNPSSPSGSSATAVYRDSMGTEISQSRLSVSQSTNGEVELNLDELILVGNGDVSIRIEREGGFIHQLVIPQSPQQSMY